MAPTPDWAAYGANERGFNPNDKRHYRNKVKNKENASQENGIAESHDNASTNGVLDEDDASSSDEE